MKTFLALFIFLSLLKATEAITPIPLTISYNEEKAALGKELYFDKILSLDGTVSCASCHKLPGNGADDKVYSIGIGKEVSVINTPTVLNAFFNLAQFWDGRAKNLHEQALMPISNSVEMGNSIQEAINRLNNSGYKEKFAKIYKDGITKDNLAEVISEFEKALITPNSRFDKYLRGDENAISEQEKRGYKSFKELGCISCHNGVNLGGNMYQHMGIMVKYNHVDITKENRVLNGRYNVTKRERDRRVFKVPSLRNIALTAPYLHDGSAKTLQDAIMDMREHQLGLFNESDEVEDIEMFLKTLTGESPLILREVIQ